MEFSGGKAERIPQRKEKGAEEKARRRSGSGRRHGCNHGVLWIWHLKEISKRHFTQSRSNMLTYEIKLPHAENISLINLSSYLFVCYVYLLESDQFFVVR